MYIDIACIMQRAWQVCVSITSNTRPPRYWSKRIMHINGANIRLAGYSDLCAGPNSWMNRKGLWKVQNRAKFRILWLYDERFENEIHYFDYIRIWYMRIVMRFVADLLRSILWIMGSTIDTFYYLQLNILIMDAILFLESCKKLITNSLIIRIIYKKWKDFFERVYITTNQLLPRITEGYATFS